MFNTITWETFLTTVILLAGGYYCITVLFFYHKEIRFWFESEPHNSIVTNSQNQRGATDPIGIMGETGNEETLHTPRTTAVSAQDLTLAETQDEEPETIKPPGIAQNTRDNLLIGSVADLLQEIKTLIQLISEYKSDKTEGESLFRTLLLRYPNLRGTTYQQIITQYICEAGKTQFVFDLQLREVGTWWEEESVSKK